MRNATFSSADSEPFEVSDPRVAEPGVPQRPVLYPGEAILPYDAADRISRPSAGRLQSLPKFFPVNVGPDDRAYRFATRWRDFCFYAPYGVAIVSTTAAVLAFGLMAARGRQSSTSPVTSPNALASSRGLPAWRAPDGSPNPGRFSEPLGRIGALSSIATEPATPADDIPATRAANVPSPRPQQSSLAVDLPVRVEAGAGFLVPLRVLEAAENRSQLRIAVRGLTGEAVVTDARQDDSGTWFIALDRLADARIVLSQTQSSSVDVEFELIDSRDVVLQRIATRLHLFAEADSKSVVRNDVAAPSKGGARLPQNGSDAPPVARLVTGETAESSGTTAAVAVQKPVKREGGGKHLPSASEFGLSESKKAPRAQRASEAATGDDDGERGFQLPLRSKTRPAWAEDALQNQQVP